MTVTFKGEFTLSAKNKYLMFGLIVLVLFLELTAKASADSAKEQLQDTMDRVIEVLQTIRSAEDIERNKGLVRQILLTRFDFAAMAENPSEIAGKILKAKRESLYRPSQTLSNSPIWAHLDRIEAKK